MSKDERATPPAEAPPDAQALPAAACETMDDVRAQIDRLDRLLVRFLAERQTYIDAAARIKADRGLIRDQARIDDVLAKVTEAAHGAGLSSDIAGPVWRVLIEQSIAHEFTAYDRRHGLENGDAGDADE